MKICSKCKQEKPLSEFYTTGRRSGMGVHARCKQCSAEDNKKPRAVELRRANVRRWQANNPNYFKDSFRAMRERVVRELGGVCECCGETQYEFLAIDHRNGGGSADRKELGHGPRYLKAIEDQGYPKGKYRILCHNCNSARGFYGKCPHESLVLDLFKLNKEIRNDH